MSDVILNCQNCDKQYLCCRAVRVELDDSEKDKYITQPALRERKDINIVAQQNGHCVYLDPNTRKCKIWDDRPRVCREYDCTKDPRVEEILKRETMKPLPKPGQKCRIFISVLALDETDKRKVSPMMVYSNAGPTACEMVEIRGNDKTMIEQAKRMLERQIMEQLGSAFEDEK